LHEIHAAPRNLLNEGQTEADFLRTNLAQIKFNPSNAFSYVIEESEPGKGSTGSFLFKISIQEKEDYLHLEERVSQLLDSIALKNDEWILYMQQNNREVHPFVFNGVSYYLRSKSSVELIHSFFESIWLNSKEVLLLNGCGDVRAFQFVKATFTPLNLFLFNVNMPIGQIVGSILEPVNVYENVVIHKTELSYFTGKNALRLNNEIFDYSLLNPSETNSIKRSLIYEGIRFSENSKQNEFSTTFSIAYTSEGINQSHFLQYTTESQTPPFENVNMLLNLHEPSVLCGHFVNAQHAIRMTLRTSEIDVIQRKNLISMPILSDFGFPSGRYAIRERFITVNDSVFHSTQLLNYRAYGWENGLLSAVVPGLGMKRVSNSLQKSILCLGMVALPSIFALTAEGVSQRYYQKYYNETIDAPIGSSPNYVRANAWHKASLISTGVSAVAWLFQFSWVIKLGIENDIQERVIRSVIRKDKLIIVDEFKEYVQF
jgi:hypothetical protein